MKRLLLVFLIILSAPNLVAQIPMFKSNLLAWNGSFYESLDGNTVVYGAYCNCVDMDDATKMMNTGENFAIKRDNVTLSVEARQPLISYDTIFYYITNFSKSSSYRLQFVPQNLSTAPVTAELIDNFLSTRTPVSMVTTTNIDVTTTNNNASIANNRFMMVFKPSIVPVTFTSITTSYYGDGSNILIKWAVQNEVNISRYEVQRSKDGINFNTIYTTNINSNYSYIDNPPAPGHNFYRIVAFDYSGKLTYSWVSVIKGINSYLQLCYNQSNDYLNVKCYGLGKHKTVSIYSLSGQKRFSTPKSEDQFNINTINFSNGMYVIIITDQNGLLIQNKFIKNK